MIGEQAEVAYTVESARQHMLQESADELINCEGHGLVAGTFLAAIVLPLEGHFPVVTSDESAVGDGDPMGIPGEIGQNGFRAREGSLGIDYPLGLPEGCEVFCKGLTLGELLEFAMVRIPVNVNT